MRCSNYLIGCVAGQKAREVGGDDFGGANVGEQVVFSCPPRSGDQFAASEGGVIAVVEAKQGKFVADDDESDVDGVVGCSQSFADEVEGARGSLARHGDDAKGIKSSLLQVAAHDALGTGFENAVVTLVERAVVIAGAGEPRDEF